MPDDKAAGERFVCVCDKAEHEKVVGQRAVRKSVYVTQLCLKRLCFAMLCVCVIKPCVKEL